MNEEYSSLLPREEERQVKTEMDKLKETLQKKSVCFAVNTLKSLSDNQASVLHLFCIENSTTLSQTLFEAFLEVVRENTLTKNDIQKFKQECETVTITAKQAVWSLLASETNQKKLSGARKNDTRLVKNGSQSYCSEKTPLLLLALHEIENLTDMQIKLLLNCYQHRTNEINPTICDLVIMTSRYAGYRIIGDAVRNCLANPAPKIQSAEFTKSVLDVVSSMSNLDILNSLLEKAINYKNEAILFAAMSNPITVEQARSKVAKIPDLSFRIIESIVFAATKKLTLDHVEVAQTKALAERSNLLATLLKRKANFIFMEIHAYFNAYFECLAAQKKPTLFSFATKNRDGYAPEVLRLQANFAVAKDALDLCKPLCEAWDSCPQSAEASYRLCLMGCINLLKQVPLNIVKAIIVEKLLREGAKKTDAEIITIKALVRASESLLALTQLTTLLPENMLGNIQALYRLNETILNATKKSQYSLSLV